MQLYEIYLITNNINNKRYVGQTMSQKGYLNRWQEHISEALCTRGAKGTSVLHKAIRKYGVDNFKVKRIVKDIPESEIDFLEQVCIKRFNTFYIDGYGYNMTLGGQGVHGYKHTDASKKKISNALKGRPSMWTPELIAQAQETKRRTHVYERRREGAWRQHLSESAKKRFETQPGTFLGKKHSDSTKDKISRANTGKKRSDDVKLAFVLQRGTPVIMCDMYTGEEIMRFNALSLARDYLIEAGYTKSVYATDAIRVACQSDTRSAYGFKWRFLSDVSTNPDECKDVD